MEKKVYKEAVCVFCGRTYPIVVIEDDGYDYYGHKRGSFRSETRGICSCPLANLAYDESYHVLKNCTTCKFNVKGSCTSGERRHEVMEVLDSVGVEVQAHHKATLKLKGSTKDCNCKFWQYNVNVIHKLIHTVHNPSKGADKVNPTSLFRKNRGAH